MVISTFVSAPIMYVSAWLLTIPSMDPKPLMASLQNVSFDISIVSLFALVSWPVMFSVNQLNRMCWEKGLQAAWKNPKPCLILAFSWVGIIDLDKIPRSSVTPSVDVRWKVDTMLYIQLFLCIFYLQVWSLAVLLLSKKYKTLPHLLTANLLLAQVSLLLFFLYCNFFNILYKNVCKNCVLRLSPGIWKRKLHLYL